MVWRRAETYNLHQSGASTDFTIARNKRIDRLRRENRPVADVTIRLSPQMRQNWVILW